VQDTLVQHLVSRGPASSKAVPEIHGLR